MSSKVESAELILKLYDLRREATMREARAWFLTFNPETPEEFAAGAAGEHNAHFRMVTSYWDMACSFVNNGAIDPVMFADANMEHVVVFAKVEPFLAGLREKYAMPYYLAHLEKLVTGLPNAAEMTEAMRKRIRAMAAARAAAAEATAAAPQG